MTYNNKHYERYAAVLSAIEDCNISTAAELKLDKNTALWDELCFATQNFINCFCLTSKTSRKKNGEFTYGNADKVKFLIKNEGKELYDIQMDILCHTISNINHILSQSSVCKKVNYTYRSVNNFINDYLRKLPPDGRVVSWDETVKGSRSSANNATYAELVPDNRYNAECVLVEKESQRELALIEEEKKRKALAEQRDALLSDVRILAGRPSLVLVRVATTYCGMKPKNLANIIIADGLLKTYVNVIAEAAKKFRIKSADLRSVLSKSPNPKHFHAASKSTTAICSKIYNINDRARKAVKNSEKDNQKNDND